MSDDSFRGQFRAIAPALYAFLGTAAIGAGVLLVMNLPAPSLPETTAPDRVTMAALGFAVLVFLLFVLSVIVYLAPTALALSRNHPDALAIAALNILLGWSFIGWVIAIVWALKHIPSTPQR
jgi:hypothetical protein